MRELLLAIGLEALWEANNEAAFRTGIGIIPRNFFARGRMAILLTPAEALKAMQAGVLMEPLQMHVGPKEPKLKLVH